MASSSSDSEDGPPPLAARIGLADQDHSPDGNARDAYVFVLQSAKHEETAALLGRLLSSRDAPTALRLVVGLSKTNRAKLGALAALEQAWISCDQRVPENVSDLAELIVSELYRPFRFLARTRVGPRDLFLAKKATSAMRQKRRFWTAEHGLRTHNWLPSPEHTFDAVVHVVQAAGGTGVHVGGGTVLTCAHVVDAADDAADDAGPTPVRTGRCKTVMFPSGRVFIAECVAAIECLDGTDDVAALALVAEVLVDAVSGGGRRAPVAVASPDPLPSARVAPASPNPGDRLFCVGNPSNVDLECRRAPASPGKRSKPPATDFCPPTWHASVGRREGQQRGSKRGGGTNAAAKHSCWTYWGHSGAPLFDADGCVAGLHSAWDDRTGMRLGQRLAAVEAVLARVPGRPRTDLGTATKPSRRSGSAEAPLRVRRRRQGQGKRDAATIDGVTASAQGRARKRARSGCGPGAG
jgi:hypothetical protein